MTEADVLRSASLPAPPSQVGSGPWLSEEPNPRNAGARREYRMPHAVWKGSVSFGLVNIPVALFPAEAPEELSLTLLDRHNLSPIGYSPINKATGKTVDRADIVKGYEVEEGSYVVVTDEDLKRANVEATQTVEIKEFVSLQGIDPIHSSTVPSKGPSPKRSMEEGRSSSGIAGNGSPRGTLQRGSAREAWRSAWKERSFTGVGAS